MLLYLGVNVPIVNLGIAITNMSPHAADSDRAVQQVHEGGDVVRDAGRPSPSTRREGTLDRLIGTPSPLDELLRDDTLGLVSPNGDQNVW
jgi:hypothetical protein